MATLGQRPFGMSPHQAAKARTRRFGRALVDIFRRDPDMPELDAANALFDWFEPDPLEIEDPTLLTSTWDTMPVRFRELGTRQAYRYEARLRLGGPKELWLLCGGVSHRFKTRVSFTKDYVRLRAYLESRDAEQFRELIAKELTQAREIASTQAAALAHTRAEMAPWVHYLYGHESFEDHRRIAREYNERDKRLAALGKAVPDRQRG